MFHIVTVDQVWHVQLNPFYPYVPFLYPLKTPENQWFSDIFKGYENGALG